MTAPDPFYETAPANAVEPKTSAAASGAGAGAIVSGFLLYLIGAVFYSSAAVPLPVGLFVTLVCTSGLSFAGGYLARHVQRPVPVAAPAVTGGMAEGEAG